MSIEHEPSPEEMPHFTSMLAHMTETERVACFALLDTLVDTLNKWQNAGEGHRLLAGHFAVCLMASKSTAGVMRQSRPTDVEEVRKRTLALINEVSKRDYSESPKQKGGHA